MLSSASPFSGWLAAAPYAVALMLAALLCTLLAAFGWRQRTKPGGPQFAAMMAAAAIWALTYALELTAPTLAGKVLFAKLEYVGIVTLPLTWFLFTRSYTGARRSLGRGALAALIFIPAVTLVLVATNEFHRLVWSGVSLTRFGLVSELVLAHGPWFWVHALYSYGLLALGSFLLIRSVYRYPLLYREQAGLLMLATVAPWVGNAVFIFHLLPAGTMDPTPFAFTVTGVALALSMSRFRLFSLLPGLLPTARNQVLEEMSDGVLVVDVEGRLVSANPAAGRILGQRASDVAGKPAQEVLGGQVADLSGTKNETGDARFEVTLGEGACQRKYDVASSPVGRRAGVALGRLLVLRDITESKRTGEALRLTQLSVDRAADLVHWVDSEGEILYANDSACVRHGYTRDEMLGMPLRDLDPELSPDAWRRRWHEIKERGYSVLETTHRTKSGELFPVEVTSNYIKHGDKEYEFAFMRDISERKQAERALQQSEDRFRTMADAMPQLGWIANADGYIYWYNKRWYEYTGTSLADMEGWGWQSVHDPEVLPAVLERWTKSIATGQSFDMEFPLRGADGVFRPFLTRVTPLRDAAGHVTQWFGTNTDISERKRAEEALKTSRAQLEAGMDLAELVNWEFDVDTGLFTFNDRFYALYGTTAELEGGYQMAAEVYASRFVHPDEQHLVAEKVNKAIVTDDPDYQGHLEHRIVRRDGEIRNIVVRFGVTKDQEGRTVKTRGANQDITERKRTEEALLQAEAQLRQSQKMEAVGQLAGGIAHDFNNLLTAIIGNSDLALQTMAPEDPNRELMADIKQVGERAAGLTRQILAFSRRQMLKPEVLCLNEVVTRLESLLERTLGEDVRVQTVLAPDLDHVAVDPHQMEQVLMNLAVNARDAMPGGGQLVVETANVRLDRAHCTIHPELKPGRHVLLAVSDTGCGMDEETKRRIFEPFFTTKDVGKGTGLGLSTVLGIVQQSGGSISVYSELGKGSTFKVYVPIYQGAETIEDDHAPEHELTRGTETILVVEDEAPVRALIVRVLSRSGYRVLEAGSATEASAVLATKGPILDLLISDMILPGGKNGREVAEDVHVLQPGLPVIFMSGYTQDSAVFNGSLGTDADFLNKPFSPDVLLQKVRKVLDQEVRGLAGRPPRFEAGPVALCAGTEQV